MDHYGQTICSVALINSETLHSRFLRLPLCHVAYTDLHKFNIYSITSCFSAADKRRFITALKCRCSFESTMAVNGHNVCVGLYCTNSFGSSWSHILTLSAEQNNTPYLCAEASTDTHDPYCTLFLETLDSMHRYNRLAAASCSTEDRSVIKEYLDKANVLGNRLSELIECSLDPTGIY